MQFLLILAILAFLALGILTRLNGFVGTLKSQLERSLAPGEQSLYISISSRMAGFPLIPFAFHDGVVMVSNKRLLWAGWILAPFWKRVKEILLDRIEDVKLNEILSAGQVSVYVGGKLTIFMTRKNRWMPFSGDLGKGLTEAINGARAATE
jgi:hypothetical protein